MDVNSEAKESLLVIDKEDGIKVKAVSGNLKTVPQTKEQEQNFTHIDKHSNLLENFFTYFMRQAKEPTHFQFFKIYSDAIENVAPVIESIAKQNNPASEEMLAECRINPTDYIKEQQLVEKPQEKIVKNQQKGHKPIDESHIDWENLKQFGITREALVKTNSLEAMLNYLKSPVLHRISATLDSVKLDTDARLSFRQTEDGHIILTVHGVRRHPELD